MKTARILIVDDDEFFRVLCSDVLTGAGYEVIVASSGAEAISIVEVEPLDIVITDLVMPGVSGLEVLSKTRQFNTLIDVIVVTGHGSIESAIEALKNGAVDYIRKPFDGAEMLHTVAACMEKKKLLEENYDMKQALRLYEVTRNITSTLDINRLYHGVIEALLQIVQAEAGISVFYASDEKTLEVMAVKYVSAELAAQLAGYLNNKHEADLKALKSVMVLPLSEFNEEIENVHYVTQAALVVPIVSGLRTAGFVVLLSGSRPFGAHDVNNASFIADYASQSYDTALKYTEAKGTAFIDSLTNLYNSKYLDIVLEKEMKRADRFLMPFTVLFLDIDDFKRINDRNDHLVGSKVLVEFGKVMLKFVREVDTVIRYGGDEYVAILVDAGYDVAMIVAERIREGIEHTHFLAEEGMDIRITASIGVATYPIHTRDKSELLKLADKAMYHAKEGSKNFVFLAPLPQSLQTPQK